MEGKSSSLEKRIRKRASYREYVELEALLAKNPTLKELAGWFHDRLDRRCAYGSGKNAAYACESLQQFTEDFRADRKISELSNSSNQLTVPGSWKTYIATFSVTVDDVEVQAMELVKAENRKQAKETAKKIALSRNFYDRMLYERGFWQVKKVRILDDTVPATTMAVIDRELREAVNSDKNKGLVEMMHKDDRKMLKQFQKNSEVCNECGEPVSPRSGRFVNRVPDLNSYEVRVSNGKRYPWGEFVCAECDARRGAFRCS